MSLFNFHLFLAFVDVLVPALDPNGSSQAGLAGKAREARFVSMRFGYAVECPTGWHLLDPDLGVFTIVNFPPAKRVKAVVIPDGGAMIGVVGKPKDLRDLEDWVKRDRKFMQGSTQRTLVLRESQGSVTRSVVELRSESGVSGVLNREVSYYLSIDGTPFAVKLFCWREDPRFAEYLGTLKQVTLGLSKEHE